MDDAWHDRPEFDQFPLLYRSWVAWCAHGPRRAEGGTLGGTVLFRAMRDLYRRFPAGEDNFIPVVPERESFTAVVDLLDIQTAIHTVPGFGRGTTESRFLDLMLPRIHTFVDVGANFGLFALRAAHRDGIQVHAFEPQPRPFRALTMARERNEFHNLQLHQEAVSDRRGRARFFVPELGSGVGSFQESHAASHAGVKAIEVATRPLDDVGEIEWSEEAALVKIDAEGAELEVLKGGRRVLEEGRPYVWLEVNPDSLEATGTSPGEVLDFLRDVGYREFLRLEPLAYDHRTPLSDPVDKLMNIVAATPDRTDGLPG